MNTAETLIKEMLEEGAKTRKMLERIPADKLNWKIHPKSTAIGRLGMHIAELHQWNIRTVTTDEYDFAAKKFVPNMPDTHAQIMEEFETTLAKTEEALRQTSEEAFMQNWKCRFGEHIIYDMPRKDVVRLNFNHLIHHRGQLSVMLRMLDVPLPNLYGPTADER